MEKRQTRVALEREIRAQWTTIVSESGCDVLRSLQALPKGRLELLGSSLKTELGENLGVLTGVQYLAPAWGSGRNVCPNSTAACRAGCLGDHAGRMPMIRGAMQWKTALRCGAPELYFRLLRLCIEGLRARAFKAGKIAAVRLDGTSDLGDASRFARQYPDVSFYDYTKSCARALRLTRCEWPNMHVTLSFSGDNFADCIGHLLRGGNVAVPFNIRKGEALPSEWHGFPVLNGDLHDFRAFDPPGHVVGLSWKGPNHTRSKALASGWLQEAQEA